MPQRNSEWDERQLLTEEIEEQFREEGNDQDNESQFKYYEIDHVNQRIVKRAGATIGARISENNFGGSRSRKSSISIVTSSNPFKLAQPLSPSRYDEPVEELSENEDFNDVEKLETINEVDFR